MKIRLTITWDAYKPSGKWYDSGSTSHPFEPIVGPNGEVLSVKTYKEKEELRNHVDYKRYIDQGFVVVVNVGDLASSWVYYDESSVWNYESITYSEAGEFTEVLLTLKTGSTHIGYLDEWGNWESLDGSEGSADSLLCWTPIPEVKKS